MKRVSRALAAELRDSFRAHAVPSPSAGGSHALNGQRAVAHWIQRLHGAFYGPRDDAKEASSSNNFQSLEHALVDAFDELIESFQAQVGPFIVDLIVTLAQEPAPAVAVENGSELDNSTTDLQKTTAQRNQPNAPLALVAVSALRKLMGDTAGDRDALVRDICREQGENNEQLHAFCTAQLESTERTVDLKLLVEMLELFAVPVASKASVHRLAHDLLSTKNHSPLLRLCETYRDTVEWDLVAILKRLAQSRDWSSAETLVKLFERENTALASVLVQEVANQQEFERAHRLVHSFGLQSQFPDIDQLYSRDALLKLVEKQRWTLALSFVGSDRVLQRMLLSHLVANGEWQHAAVLARDRMGMEDFDPQQYGSGSDTAAGNGNCNGTPSSSSSSPSLASLPVNGYLELPLPDDCVVFCETDEAVRVAAAHVLADTEAATAMAASGFTSVVGLDVEWKPTSTKIASVVGGGASATAVASVLQIATSTRVFLIDLLALHESEFLLDEFLRRLLTSPAILKVGFGFDSDLKVLHQTFPERDAFRSVAPFLELASVVYRACGASAGNSLSSATARVLGHPLDKRMQLSNWDERPLSHSQAVYAALDAFCLLQITDFIRDHGLRDDKGAITTWEHVTTQMIGSVTLSAPIQDTAAIAQAASHRRAYVAAWQSTMAGSHGTIALKDLLSTNDVESFWTEAVQSYEQENADDSSMGIDAEMKIVPSDQLQALLAADDGHSSTYVAVNAMCFLADDKPCVACIDANTRLDTARLASLCGVSRRKIKLATAVECETLWGYSPGTVPPFAHRVTDRAVPIYVDNGLKTYTKWVTGSGTHGQSLIIPSTAFFRLIKLEATADIAIHRTKPSSTETNPVPVPATAAGEAPPMEEYKFLADTMMVRVGRWLRTIGVDVAAWDPSAYKSAIDKRNALVARAAAEQRIILTRDRKLATRRDAEACFFVTKDDPNQQFQEIVSHFSLKLDKDALSSRCAKCNGEVREATDRAYIQRAIDDGKLHENALVVAEAKVWECTSCLKMFWLGPRPGSTYVSTYDIMLQKF